MGFISRAHFPRSPRSSHSRPRRDTKVCCAVSGRGLVAIALFTLASFGCGFSQNLTEFRDRTALDLIDFRIAFLVIGAIGLVASFRYLALPQGAGAEVSGHAPGN